MRKSLFGLSITFSGLAIFCFLAWQVTDPGSSLVDFDQRTAQAMQEHAGAHPQLLGFCAAITHAGGVPGMTALTIVLSLLLLLYHQPRLAAVCVLAAALGAGVNVGAKGFIGRDRPGELLRDSAVHERNHSYPSGHSMGSVIGYGSLAYVGVVLLRRRGVKVALIAAVATLVAAIGFSRIYLRAHWCTDVIGGFAIGTSWLALCIMLMQWRAEERKLPG